VSKASASTTQAVAPPPSRPAAPTPKRSRKKGPVVPAVPGRARIIAIANQKGGVGKSTTAVSLGAALADIGYRVLVADLDPQGNASTGMGIRHDARDVTVYDVVVSEAKIEQAIVPTPVERLHAVPATIDLAGAEIELVSQFSRESRLKKAIEPVLEGMYDFILLDCPPSLGLLTINALTAAEELIVPIQCEYYALEGLGQLLHNVRLVQQNINPSLRLTGIVMTMFDSRTNLSEQVVDEVRKYFRDRVYDVIIPRTVRLSEAPGFGQPITVYDPRSRAAETYRSLAAEVAARPRPEVEPMPVLEDMASVMLVRAPPVASVSPVEPAEPAAVQAISDETSPPGAELESEPVPPEPEPEPPEPEPEPPAVVPPTPPEEDGKAPTRPRTPRTERVAASSATPTSAPTPSGEPAAATAPPVPAAAPSGDAGEVRGAPHGRRVVVIDDRAEEAAVHSGQKEEMVRIDRPPESVSSREHASGIGDTLPEEHVRKKRWWQFGKGGGA